MSLTMGDPGVLLGRDMPKFQAVAIMSNRFHPLPPELFEEKHTGWNVLDSSKQLDAVHFLIPNLLQKPFIHHKSISIHCSLVDTSTNADHASPPSTASCSCWCRVSGMPRISSTSVSWTPWFMSFRSQGPDAATIHGGFHTYGDTPSEHWMVFVGGKSICKWMIKVGYPYFRKPTMLTYALDCFGSMPPNMERFQPGLNLGIPMQTWNGAGWNKVDTTRAARKLLAANVQNIQNVQPMVGVIIIPFIRLKIQNLWNHWKKILIPDVTTSPVDHLCWLDPTPSSVEASFVVDLVLPVATRHALGTSLPSARHLRPVPTVSEDLSAIALLVSN